eukprot:TRINITY_DN7384_c0_g1_i1.p1 TRINITY_DN7384_c0_g1~~TRINITY_DN7384_c0_g1_i1.p1  ORF type:complete len:425 (+),score=125.98 TRINITY_DN7384_c0_g1_i1:38-1312(+)
MDEEKFVMYATDLSQDDPVKRLEATTYIRKILSIETNPPIDKVIKSGMVPRLITFLSMDDQPALQFEATWAITNITSGTQEQTSFVVEKGAVLPLINLLGSKSDDVAEQAVWALGNLAGDSIILRDTLLNMGIVTKILPLLGRNSNKISILRNASWTVSNLARGKPVPKFHLLAPLLPDLTVLIQHGDDEVVSNILWTLSYMTDGSSEQIQAVINCGIVDKAMKYLGITNSTIATPALRIIGNIVTGDDLQTQFVLDLGVVDKIMPIFSSPKTGVLKELCWMLSNITAGTHKQIQLLVDHQIFPKVVHLLETSTNDVKTEAAWTISNASNGSKAQLRYLFEIGTFPPLVNILKEGKNMKIISVVLECFKNFFAVRENDTLREDKVKNIYLNEFLNLGGEHILNSLADKSVGDIVNEILDTYIRD